MSRVLCHFTRPLDEGEWDPVTGAMTGKVTEIVLTERADVVDDAATIARYAEGDEAVTKGTVMVFLPRESGWARVYPGDTCEITYASGVESHTVTGTQRTGLVVFLTPDASRTSSPPPAE